MKDTIEWLLVAGVWIIALAGCGLKRLREWKLSTSSWKWHHDAVVHSPDNDRRAGLRHRTPPVHSSL